MLKAKLVKRVCQSRAKKSSASACEQAEISSTSSPSDSENTCHSPADSRSTLNRSDEAGEIPDLKTLTGVDITAKVKELLRLAQEQGRLTYNDIHEALPESDISAEAMDEIYTKLRNLEVEIVDAAEVDQ